MKISLILLLLAGCSGVGYVRTKTVMRYRCTGPVFADCKMVPIQIPLEKKEPWYEKERYGF